MRVLELNLAMLALLGVASCSDPVEPPPKAAFLAKFSAKSGLLPGEACLQQVTAKIGQPAPTNARDEGIAVPDGQEGSAIACSIKGGGSYTISATGSASGGGFAISGSVGADGNGTIDNATFISSATQTELTNAAPCTIRASAKAAAGERFRISPGEMFATITCPLIEDAGQRPTTQCAAVDVLVLLQNCNK